MSYYQERMYKLIAMFNEATKDYQPCLVPPSLKASLAGLEREKSRRAKEKSLVAEQESDHAD